MIKIPLIGIHDFKKTKDFFQHDRLEIFSQMKCSNCRLIGRRINRESFVLVSDTYSKERIELCQRDNFIDKYLGKQIQISCVIKAGKKYSNALIYSIHIIIKPPIGYINGEQGYWIQGIDIPIKIHFDECINYPLLPKKSYRVRKKFPIIKRTRTSPPIIKRKRTN